MPQAPKNPCLILFWSWMNSPFPLLSPWGKTVAAYPLEHRSSTKNFVKTSLTRFNPTWPTHNDALPFNAFLRYIACNWCNTYFFANLDVPVSARQNVMGWTRSREWRIARQMGHDRMGAQFTVYRSLVVKILAFSMNDRYRGDMFLDSCITFVYF